MAVPSYFQTRSAPPAVLLCLSHLRWDFVYQRPQHLLSRASKAYQVVYFEEPLPLPSQAGVPQAPSLQTRMAAEGVLVATPLLPEGIDAAASDAQQRRLLDTLLARLAAPVQVVWFYTAMALDFAGHVRAPVTVFDCMDELAGFRGASPRLALLERRLLRHVDLVFTGGRSLHQAKQRRHHDVHLFPSSVDAAHFRRSRAGVGVGPEPADQAALPHPRIGFFGVIDERMDCELLESVAAARPDWQFVMLGPTAKIDPAALPRRANLHWLGRKLYAELPAYLAGWDAGLMPFALNEATRFISPTKTPEFLAAGIPLVSTPVPDVVAEWQKDGLVEIADGPAAVVAALETLLRRPRPAWQMRVDHHLERMSWDATWARMMQLIENRAKAPPAARALPEGSIHG